MRQVVDRVTCDDCGRVVDFERCRTNTDGIVARNETTTEWLIRCGWRCVPVIGSSFVTLDHCPDCKNRASGK